MADHDKMTHDGSDGSTPAERVERAGYHYQTTGENVAQGQKTCEEVIRAWMNSPHHKENILKPEFTEIGAACYVTEAGKIMPRRATGVPARFHRKINNAIKRARQALLMR